MVNILTHIILYISRCISIKKDNNQYYTIAKQALNNLDNKKIGKDRFHYIISLLDQKRYIEAQELVNRQYN